MEQNIIGKLQAFNAEVFRTEDYKKVKTITPDAMPIPDMGHVGYVHIENPYDYATLNPTWTDVDMDEGEADC